MIQKPFFLGKLQLPSNIFCAPLAGCSDAPFRKMLSQYCPGIMYCEMVKMDALIRNDSDTYRMLEYDGSMHPIGAQLCGSTLKFAGPCAKIIEDLGFDVIDLNCGCPVDKVTKDGSGSALLKNPEKIGDILAAMVSAVKIPVTVKIRAGWDSHEIVAPLITQIAEQAGAQAICIHGRTRAQAYRGPANWDYIKLAKEAARNIKVIGNGDLFSPEAVQNIFTHTNCDAVLIARGTMGTPWIVQDIYDFFQSGVVTSRTYEDYKNGLLHHISFITSHYLERKALLDIRRISSWYLKPGKGAKHLREALVRAQSIAEVFHHINTFAWETIDFSSVAVPLQESCCE